MLIGCLNDLTVKLAKSSLQQMTPDLSEFSKCKFTNDVFVYVCIYMYDLYFPISKNSNEFIIGYNFHAKLE